MTQILFYGLIKPVSLLPSRALYLISDFLYFLLFNVVGYRKEVVIRNITNSFPDQSPAFIKLQTRLFYHHFCDLIVESVKLFSVSKKRALEQCVLLNPEVMDNLYDQGKHVIIVGGHYNNWEMLAVTLNAQVKHQVNGIYTPLSNKFFNVKFAESRTQMGTGLVHRNKVKSYFAGNHKTLTATVFGADQSPTFSNRKTFWTNFMNQETAVTFGTERYAVEYNYPVVFVTINKVKRGYYTMFLKVLEDSPKDTTYGSITERHTQMLEEDIKKEPQYYLWTHNRWKHKRQTEEISAA